MSLGSWFIGLEVEHIDERNMCCGTPPGIFFYTCHLLYENLIETGKRKKKKTKSGTEKSVIEDPV